MPGRTSAEQCSTAQSPRQGSIVKVSGILEINMLWNNLKHTRIAAFVAVLAVLPTGAARADSILFVGNSFTFGYLSAVWHYRKDSVSDLNNEGVGGMPALFKLFTQEAGFDWKSQLGDLTGQGPCSGTSTTRGRSSTSRSTM